MNYKISIIVPVYNGQKWLKRCLESLISQTYRNIEIIVVNDGSTDESEKICKEYENKYENIKAIKKKNGGVSSARNLGIQMSEGDFIQFVDCDDTLPTNICEKLIQNVEEGVSVYQFGISKRLKGKEILQVSLEKKYLWIQKGNYDDFCKWRTLFASVCSKLYRREYIRQLFLENVDYGEDYMFNLTNLKAGTLVKRVDDVFYHVNIDSSKSLNRKYRKGRVDHILNYLHCQDNVLKEIFPDEYDSSITFDYGVVTLFNAIEMCAKNMTRKEFFEEIATVEKNIFAQKIIKGSVLQEAYRKAERKTLQTRRGTYWYFKVIYELKCIKKGYQNKVFKHTKSR